MKQRKKTAACKKHEDLIPLHLRQTVAAALFVALCGVMPLVILDGYQDITRVKSILVWTSSAAAFAALIVLRLIAPLPPPGAVHFFGAGGSPYSYSALWLSFRLFVLLTRRLFIGEYREDSTDLSHGCTICSVR